MSDSKMTAAERQELGKLVRHRAKIAKDDAERRGAWQLADAEAKLATICKKWDTAWTDSVAELERGIEELNAKIAVVCQERGVPEGFRPSACLSWMGRGENALASRRVELRKVAQTQVEASVKEAKLQIDREVERQLTQLAVSGLLSPEAKNYLGNMPRPEDLMPPLTGLPLHSGERVELEELETVTRVTSGRNTVTEKSNACNVCANCEKNLEAGRGKYCSNACRQAAHRKRQKAALGNTEHALLTGGLLTDGTDKTEALDLET